MYRYIIYATSDIIPKLNTEVCIFLFSFNIPIIIKIVLKNKIPKIKVAIFEYSMLSKSISSRIAYSKNIIPDNVSIIIYLGLIFSLQYLHFPPKNI